jgi:hypothetical protein
MTTIDDRVKPMSYIGKSPKLLKLQKQSMEVLKKRNPDILEAMAANDFNRARELLNEDMTIKVREAALVNRWIRLERHFSFIRYTPLPS